MTAATTYAYVTTTPGLLSGQPHIVGHRIRVADIAVAHETHGWSPEEICEQFPGLTLSQVHSALAYYHDHRPEIEAFLDESARTAQAYQSQYPDSVG